MSRCVLRNDVQQHYDYEVSCAKGKYWNVSGTQAGCPVLFVIAGALEQRTLVPSVENPGTGTLLSVTR